MVSKFRAVVVVMVLKKMSVGQEYGHHVFLPAPLHFYQPLFFSSSDSSFFVRFHPNFTAEDNKFREKSYKELNSEKKYNSKDLAAIHGCSISTVRRHQYSKITHFIPYVSKKSVVIMDTAYFGHPLGVMIFLKADTGRIPNRKHVKNELNILHKER